MTVRVVKAWCVGVQGVSFLSMLGFCAWAFTQSAWPVWARIVLAMGVVTYGAWLCWFEWHVAPVRLQWTGQSWILGEARAGCERVSGRAYLMVDMGQGLLVRFVPENRRLAPRWLPLWCSPQASQNWHALRCALVTAMARPSPGAGRLKS